MTEEQAKVREYHQRFGCTVNDRPTWAGADEHRVRVALIEEELAELRNAGEARDLVEVADALADLLYAVYGAAVAYGIDLEPVFEEIHAANLTKGGGARRDGKVLKGPDYRPPRVARIIREQLGLAAAAVS
jgi:predicted HAD superfamily Cof-like phosphohydrolase